MLEKIFGKTTNSIKLRRFLEFIQPHDFRIAADQEANVGRIIIWLLLTSMYYLLPLVLFVTLPFQVLDMLLFENKGVLPMASFNPISFGEDILNSTRQMAYGNSYFSYSWLALFYALSLYLYLCLICGFLTFIGFTFLLSGWCISYIKKLL